MLTDTTSCPGEWPPTRTATTPRGDLELLVDGPHSAVGGGPRQAGHRVGVGVLGEVRSPRERTGPEVQLALGHHELRVREQAEVADVVVVQVRHHDLLHLGAVDPEPLQRLDRLAQGGAPAALPGCAAEARVDEHRLPVAAQHVEEVVHAVRAVGLPNVSKRWYASLLRKARVPYRTAMTSQAVMLR